MIVIYLMVIVFMVFVFFYNLFKGNFYVYLFIMVCIFFVSILEVLGYFGLKVGILNNLLFYFKGFGWIILVVVGLVVGLIYGSLKKKRFENNIR